MDFTVDDFVAFCVNLLFWYIVIQIALGFLAGYLGNKVEEHNDRVHGLIEEVAKLVHIVEIEKHGDIEYWYDKDDGVFLGQGRDQEEVVDNLRKRFSQSHMFFFDHDDEGMWVIRAPNWRLEPFVTDSKR